MPRAQAPTQRFCVRHGVTCLWAGGDTDPDEAWHALSLGLADAFGHKPPPKPVSKCRQATAIDQRMRAHIFDPKRKDELADALVELQQRYGTVGQYAEQVGPLALPSGREP